MSLNKITLLVWINKDMALNNYYDYLKEKPIYYSIIVWGAISLIFLNFYMSIWGFEKIAIYKAKDQSNIIEGCAYHRGEFKTKYGGGYYLNIGGTTIKDDLITRKKFPFNIKKREFYKDINADHFGCHTVKYIKIDLYVTKKIFLYDYLK